MKQNFLFNSRSALALVHDVFAAFLAWYGAFLLRFNFDLPAEHIVLLYQTIWIVLLIRTSSFLLFGLYRGTWRFASIPDLKRILLTVLATSVILVALLFMLNFPIRVPRSVLILDPLLLVLLMGGSRFIYRSIKEHQLQGPYKVSGAPVILLGGGEAAISLIKDLSKSKDWHVVGILDDDPKIHGREILNVKVHGGIDNLPKIKSRYDLRHAIIVMPSSEHSDRRRAMNLASHEGLEVLTIPHIDDLMTGRVSLSQVRPVDVEDLLGRDSVSLDNSGLKKLIKDQVIMVTGAGGSIGSELCRQIVKFKPSTIICFDISEYALYQIEEEFIRLSIDIKLIYLVGDVKDYGRLENILQKYKPTLVFHAAAYKHVPLMERHNVLEAINNNVLGTYTLAKACQKAKVNKCVLISTDKAVNPTNVMGASKRLAEMVCQGLQAKNGTKFIMVRFGNVLGSSGSVIPKFREQIKSGGPITVTHPEITRYFMSISEATQLVMQAGLMGEGGEILVLDMGEPVKIADLARDMIKLSGFQEEEIKIKFVGLRPGEKLYEELLADDEDTLPTPHKKLRVAKARSFNHADLSQLMIWIDKIQGSNEKEIKRQLTRWVKEYLPDLG